MKFQEKTSHSETKILVVDDERLIRLVICSKLKRAGYETIDVATVDEAVSILKEKPHAFCAVLSDIVMGDMDGFVFRDIVRGLDNTLPFFFLTALDPEEGSGFLKRIVSDPMSFYLPKSASTDVLVGRVQRIVASRRIEQFIVRQMEETQQALKLAAYVQSSMLPHRSEKGEFGFYTTYWHPKETVSGDLVETALLRENLRLYVLGDIQGHGTSAALAMTAVQSTLKRLMQRTESMPILRPHALANLLQKFFRDNLADVSYMTALIFLHDAKERTVRWISCGAPDLAVYGAKGRIPVNPEQRGGLPIGLLAGTTYSEKDEVFTELPTESMCLAFTDGILDLARKDGTVLAEAVFDSYFSHLAVPALANGSAATLPYQTMRLCQEAGYDQYNDDVTLVAFGTVLSQPGIYEAVMPVAPNEIDAAARRLGAWCAEQGWDETLSERLQLVFEEKMMNLNDHGFDERERLRQCANIRLRLVGETAALTVWDCGSPEPSLAVAAGDADTAFEMANRRMSDHGRGRLMLRQICCGVARNRYDALNETIYYVPITADDGSGNGKGWNNP